MYPPSGGEKMIKFIHAADLHLDTPFLGLKEISEDLAKIMRDAPFQSFQKIIDEAIHHQVDFLLLSGDLYNTQKMNIKAQSIFIKELKRLESHSIPVFLIRGNHDFLTKESEKMTLQLPANVYVYTAEVETHVIKTQNNKKIAVSAFSYESQWVQERKIQSYPERRATVDMHIGMLHGAMEGSMLGAGNYAPFSLDELRQKNYDYWALGHVHQRQKLSSYPLAIYPGNIQGLHKNEKGEKGCLLVEWSERGEKIEFIATAPIVWEKIQIELTKVKNINQLINKISEKLIEKEFTEDYLIHLQVRVNKNDDEKMVELVQEPLFIKELTNQLNLTNLWIADIEIIVDIQTKERALKELYPLEWSKALEQIQNRKEFSEVTENILSNIPDKYLLENNTEDYRKRMIEKAIDKIYLKDY